MVVIGPAASAASAETPTLTGGPRKEGPPRRCFLRSNQLEKCRKSRTLAFRFAVQERETCSRQDSTTS